MNRHFLSTLAASALGVVLGAVPAPLLAQGQAAMPPAPAGELTPKQTPEQRIAELEAALTRQTRIADNARQSMDAMRGEMKLKDELLVLGRERNAQLYEIAMEIAKKYVRSNDWEPFFQTERVRMENLRQSYEDRLQAARIFESTLPPSVQQRMDAELGKGPAAPAAPTPQD